MVPGAGNPMAWDRYAYALNSPIMYNDPGGHSVDCGPYDSECQEEVANEELHQELDEFVPPETVELDEMIEFFEATLSPAEFELLKDENGNVNYVLAYRMKLIMDQAFKKTNELFPGQGHNDQADAFRHAYWNGLLTREFGADFAEAFTTAHKTSYFASDTPEEVFMDMHNNEIGRDIAVSNPGLSKDQLAQDVLGALYGGQLYVWDGNDIYYSNQCPACSHGGTQNGGY
jgi:hypothetical protein